MKLLLEIFADTVFPLFCVYCDAPGAWICSSCHAQIPRILTGPCFGCDRPTDGHGKTCMQCIGEKTHLDRVVVSCRYKTLSRAIHTYKYSFVRDLSAPFSEILLQTYTQHFLHTAVDLILPIPLHPKRLRWRGFNQSELLAQNLANALSTPSPILSTDILSRARHTATQMTLEKQERLQNVAGAFDVSDAVSLTQKNILLIDDVITTGATLDHAALTLLHHGAHSVSALVLAGEE